GWSRSSPAGSAFGRCPTTHAHVSSDGTFPNTRDIPVNSAGMSPHGKPSSLLHLTALLIAAACWSAKPTHAADPTAAAEATKTPAVYTPFAGEKSRWHGDFDRYDFVMDEATLAIEPLRAPAGENFAVREPAKGQRRCVVVVPK